MIREYLKETIELIERLMGAGIGTLAALELVDRQLRLDIQAMPELQGSCGICLREVDHLEASGEYVGTDPIAVVRCANGCRGCEECVHPCTDGRCCRNYCQDCLTLCSACEQPFCEDHLIKSETSSDVFCEQCCPPKVMRAAAMANRGGDY